MGRKVPGNVISSKWCKDDIFASMIAVEEIEYSTDKIVSAPQILMKIIHQKIVFQVIIFKFLI